MTFKVIGASRDTGLDCEMDVDAQSERDAIAIAGQRMLIRRVKHVAPEPAPVAQILSDGGPPPLPPPGAIAYQPVHRQPFTQTWLVPATIAAVVLFVVFALAIIFRPRVGPSVVSAPAQVAIQNRVAIQRQQAIEQARRAALNKQFDAAGGAPMLRPTEGLQVGQIGRLPPNCRILQITGAERMIVHTNDKVYVVRGVSTAGRVDDTALQVDGPFEVTGTEMYATVDGASKTVFVVEPL